MESSERLSNVGKPSFELKRCKIVVVDDAEIIRQHYLNQFSMMLRERDKYPIGPYQVCAVSDLIWDNIKRDWSGPVILITDYEMLEKNGLELVEEFRKIYPNCPHAIVTNGRLTKLKVIWSHRFPESDPDKFVFCKSDIRIGRLLYYFLLTITGRHQPNN